MTPQSSALRRGVILGASNVFRNISTVVATAQCAWGEPLDVYIAAGHGRSYGMWNRVLGYSVPGIVQSGIWEALEQRRDLPTAALVTDIGNDLLYGASVDQIVGWVETCLSRLRPQCERLVISELPLVAVAQLKPAHFRMLRTALFPRSRLGFDELMTSARCLNDEVVQLAEKYSATIVTPPATWYGFDPIHIQRRQVSSAWRLLLRQWSDAPDTLRAQGALWHWCRLRMQRVHVQRFLNRETRAPQPCVRYANGTTVSLY